MNASNIENTKIVIFIIFKIIFRKITRETSQKNVTVFR